MLEVDVVLNVFQMEVQHLVSLGFDNELRLCRVMSRLVSGDVTVPTK